MGEGYIIVYKTYFFSVQFHADTTKCQARHVAAKASTSNDSNDFKDHKSIESFGSSNETSSNSRTSRSKSISRFRVPVEPFDAL